MKKLIIVIPLLLSLIACSEPNTNTPAVESKASAALHKTKGLEDCNLYNFQTQEGNSGSTITIVRCGNKPTVSITEPNGKTTQTTVLIDDIGEIPVESK